MAELYSKKAMAKAFFGLDISNPERSSTLQVAKHTKKKPGGEVEVELNRKSLLLDLPVEIRLKIYDLLLVGRFDRPTNPRWTVGDTNQKKVSLDVIQHRSYRTMEPGILQSCKQIYLEAVPVLYSQNVFEFNDPMLMFRLMGQIGDGQGHMFWNTSLGKDIDVARALAGLSELGLERLQIKGYYAKPWPAYFRDKFGAEVVEAEEGRPHVLKEGHPNLELFRSLNDEFFEDFSQYQEGTESLNPWEPESIVSCHRFLTSIFTLGEDTYTNVDW